MSDERLLPMDLRIYAQTLFGNRDKISEADFSKRELEAIRSAVARNQQRTGAKSKGNVGYQDYPSGEEIGPGYAPVESTLGRFNYNLNPDGSIRATDRYDFWNDERAPSVLKYEAMTPVERGVKAPLNAIMKLLKLDPRGAAGEIGDAFIGREGRDVDITLSPIEKYAAGGIVDSVEGGYNPARVQALAQQLRAECFPD
jgi:hypothetical protein